MRFFSYESKLSQLLIKLAQSCCLNLIWFLCSIPIFTIGASTTALYYVTLKIARDEEGHLFRPFFRSFRQNFRQATQLWLALLGVGLVLGTDLWVLWHLFRSSTGALAVFWTLLLALVIAASVAWAMVMCYVFPLLASVENTNRAMVKNAFFMSARYLFCTIIVLLIHFAMFFLVVRLFMPLIIFGEGFCALLSSVPLSGVIAAVTTPRAEEDEAAEEEA